MPKRFRRSRKTFRKRRTRKKIVKRSGKKYGSGYPRPLHLRLRPAGFPSMQTVRLRFCTSGILDPRPAIPGGTASLSYLAYSTNSLVAPPVAHFGSNTYSTIPLDATSVCFMHHDEYSKVYSNYRVTHSKINITCSPEFVDRNLLPVGTPEAVPTYVTLQNSNTLPGSAAIGPQAEAADAMSKIHSMRSDGKRFIKINPWVTQTGSNVRSSGRQSRIGASTAWSSKWFKHGTNPEETQAHVNNRPTMQQYFIVSAIPGASGQNRDPCPVRVEITIEARVTYWRKRQFNLLPVLEDISNPQDPNP